MNQKLSDWASIAEIVSGIAVVLSLLFLTKDSLISQMTTILICFNDLK